jgi:hypothetical protein
MWAHRISFFESNLYRDCAPSWDLIVSGTILYSHWKSLELYQGPLWSFRSVGLNLDQSMFPSRCEFCHRQGAFARVLVARHHDGGTLAALTDCRSSESLDVWSMLASSRSLLWGYLWSRLYAGGDGWQCEITWPVHLLHSLCLVACHLCRWICHQDGRQEDDSGWCTCYQKPCGGQRF